MLIAILSDIHANREAYETCLEAAAAAGAERIVLLGDIVGYGADPQWCVDKTRELVAAGAICLRGNHDEAAVIGPTSMNETATTAIEWTRTQLSPEALAFLADLPMTVEEDDRLYVHADASSPARWHYVTDAESAGIHFDATPKRVSFCGHLHQPGLYSRLGQGTVTAFTPNSAGPLPLLTQRRWLAVMGAVGQPRDRNPAAAYGLYDDRTRDLRFMRAAYDVETAANKIRAAGLPDSLATRLLSGR